MGGVKHLTPSRLKTSNMHQYGSHSHVFNLLHPFSWNTCFYRWYCATFHCYQTQFFTVPPHCVSWLNPIEVGGEVHHLLQRLIVFIIIRWVFNFVLFLLACILIDIIVRIISAFLASLFLISQCIKYIFKKNPVQPSIYLVLPIVD